MYQAEHWKQGRHPKGGRGQEIHSLLGSLPSSARGERADQAEQSVPMETMVPHSLLSSYVPVLFPSTVCY